MKFAEPYRDLREFIDALDKRKKLEWDVERMECTNLPEVNRYVRRDYRKGWEVRL